MDTTDLWKYLSKWDKSVPYSCQEKHDLFHLLFICLFDKEAWKHVFIFLKLDIKLLDLYEVYMVINYLVLKTTPSAL